MSDKKEIPEDLNLNLHLRSLVIKNFKSHESIELPFEKLNEVFGKNRTGKTSIHEALNFCLEGGKNDKDKVKKGCEEAKVTAVFTSDDGHKLTIHSKIDSDGETRWKANFDGVDVLKPKQFIKRLITCGSFNPQELLEKKGRTERLINLLPLSIKKEDVIIERTGESFPIHDPDSIEWDRHAIHVLTALDKDLRNVRRSLGQKKDLLQKSFQDSKEEHEDSILEFKRAYNYEPLECKMSYKEAIENKTSFEEQEKTKHDKFKENENLIKEGNKKLDEFELAEDEVNSKIMEAEKELARLKENKKNIAYQVSIKNKEIAELDKEKENFAQDKNDYEKKLLIFKNKETECFRAQKIKEKDQALTLKEKEKEKAEELHKNMDYIVKEDFKKFKLKVLEPIKNKIPEIDFNEDGQFVVNGKSIDELSESETIDLAMKFMNLDKKSNLVAIDGAECLDKETIDKINWGDKDIILIRVADKPLGGKWLSHEMKEEK